MNKANDSLAWPRILPFALLIAGLALQSLIDAALPTGQWYVWMQDWIYVVRTAPIALVLCFVWMQLPELKVFTMSRSDLLISIVVGAIVFVLWITLGPLVRLSLDPDASKIPWPNEPGQQYVWIVLRVCSAVVLIPIIEEIFWRSYLMRRLDQFDFYNLPAAAVSWFSIVVTSFVFALAHRELLAAFITGIIYAYLYRRTGKLWTAIVAHGTTNLLLAAYVLKTGSYEYW